MLFLVVIVLVEQSFVSIKLVVVVIATLALGSRLRQRLARGWAKRKPWSHISCSQECKRVQGNKPSHSQRCSHFGKLDSQWTLEFLESDCKGQNPMDWVVFYTIEMVLELRCLKWAWMTHLDIWNTSYGKKKGREFNWQFDSQSLKVRNCHKFLTCRCLATYRWKAFD